jgi:uncharacterized protein YyaL (SSP411 family)
MLKGFLDAYAAFGDQSYLEIALKNANFISSKMIDDDGKIYRNFKNGKRTINGFLDDYSFTIEAFILLYESTFNEQWLYKAKKSADYVIKHFKDDDSGLFYYTADLDDALITRKMELSDNVIPASNSSFAKALFKLGNYFYNEEYMPLSVSMLGKMKSGFATNPLYYSNWGILIINFVYPYYEVAIVGDEFERKLSDLKNSYHPNSMYLGGQDEGTLDLLKQKLVADKTMIYVCENKVCSRPTENVDEALQLLSGF